MANSTFQFGIFKSNQIPDGTKDGVNDTFTVPGDDLYLSSTLMVHLNGNLYRPDSIITKPDKKTFQISSDTLPIETDDLTCTYITATTA